MCAPFPAAPSVHAVTAQRRVPQPAVSRGISAVVHISVRVWTPIVGAMPMHGLTINYTCMHDWLAFLIAGWDTNLT